ncbi:hypothetical protein EUX98_g3860 [Antrodiella citrinella]|uniref:Uncharacterized protein n=1 Tax=Antrodiella citrinella TaxID=2447956 RepID=A0A4S4N3K7_9APHY|nr:hypothetical protein EUX98_g3860 [Antrodiella citrinella]
MSHSRHRNISTPVNRAPKRMSMGGANPTSSQYPPQLSIFVVFEKKAGLIRIADAAVGEVDLYDEAAGTNALLNPAGSLNRRPRTSWDGMSFHKEPKASWIPPVLMVIKGQANGGLSHSMYLVTRGKHTHLLPSPLPANLPSIPPYRTFTWTSPPSNISTRICRQTPPLSEEGSSESFLQVIAFGEEGVEVQEVPLSNLTVNMGKGKSKVEEPVRAVADLGGDAGFLCTGGFWHDDDPARPGLMRSDSTASYDSDSVLEDISSSRTPTRLKEVEGVYGWVRKGAEDWRVFWVGGTGDRDTDNYQHYAS